MEGASSKRPTDFQTTCWSMIIGLRDGASSDYQTALEELARLYWRPVYAFIRRRGNDATTAEDLTQAFFVALIERDAFRHLEREKGRFRGYLRTAVRHFLVGEHRHRTARRRHPGKSVLGIHDLEEAMGPLADENDVPPDVAYQREWARDVLRKATAKLEADYRERGRDAALAVFKHYVASRDGGAAPISQEALAAEHGLTVSQVNNYIHGGKVSFREAIRATIADTVSDDADLDEELVELRSCFGA